MNANDYLNIDQKINIKALYEKYLSIDIFYKDLMFYGSPEVLSRLSIVFGHRHLELWSNHSFKNERISERKLVSDMVEKMIIES